MMFEDNIIDNDISNWIDLPTGAGGIIIPVSVAMTILQNAHDSRLAEYGEYSSNNHQVYKAPGVYVLRDMFTNTGSLKNTIEANAYAKYTTKGISAFKVHVVSDKTFIANSPTSKPSAIYSTNANRTWVLTSWSKQEDASDVTLNFDEYDQSGNLVDSFSVSGSVGTGKLVISTFNGVTDDKYYWVVYALLDDANGKYAAGVIWVDMTTKDYNYDEVDSGTAGILVVPTNLTNGVPLWYYVEIDNDGSENGNFMLGDSKIDTSVTYSPNDYLYAFWGFTHDIWTWEMNNGGYKNNVLFWMLLHIRYGSNAYTDYTYEMIKWSKLTGKQTDRFSTHKNTDGWSRGSEFYWQKWLAGVDVSDPNYYFIAEPYLDDNSITSETIPKADERMKITDPLGDKESIIHITDTCYLHRNLIDPSSHEYEYLVRLLPNHEVIGVYDIDFNDDDMFVHNNAYTFTNNEVQRIDNLKIGSVESGWVRTNEINPPLDYFRGYLIVQKYEPQNTEITVDLLKSDNSVYASNIPERTVINVPRPFKLKFNFNIYDNSKVCDPPRLQGYSLLVW